jgi:hypothetical protein
METMPLAEKYDVGVGTKEFPVSRAMIGLILVCTE